jgi:hypothetical protein
LRASLAGWVIEADTDAAARRRKDAEAEASVDYRRRDDGLDGIDRAHGRPAGRVPPCARKVSPRDDHGYRGE